jgi:hypothetical protein
MKTKVLNTNVRIFTRMIKVISLMSYCTLLDIIALVNCAESGRWSFVSLPHMIFSGIGEYFIHATDSIYL